MAKTGSETNPPCSMKFEWRRATPVVYRCDWNGMILQAWVDGSWMVQTASHQLLISYHSQTIGSDIMDARRRAQAAAMILKKTGRKKGIK
jgi:hypothetical protein